MGAVVLVALPVLCLSGLMSPLASRSNVRVCLLGRKCMTMWPLATITGRIQVHAVVYCLLANVTSPHFPQYLIWHSLMFVGGFLFIYSIPYVLLLSYCHGACAVGQ